MSTSTQAPVIRHEIKALQYGRFIAALLVCLYHAENELQHHFGGYAFDNIFRAGHSGVEFFFLLSGFIIFTAHRKDIGRPEKIWGFYIKRFIRIFPLFWCVVIPVGVMVLTHTHSDPLLTWPLFLQDVALIPRPGTLTLPPAWTLQHELLFYTLFGVFILNRWMGAALFIAWQAACLANYRYRFVPEELLTPDYKAFGVHNLGFGMGILIAMLYERVNFRVYKDIFFAIGVLSLLALIYSFYFEWQNNEALLHSWVDACLYYYLIYGGIILSLLALDNDRPDNFMTRSLLKLGSTSYALYLIHIPLFDYLALSNRTAIIRDQINLKTVYFVLLTSAIVFAILIDTIEEPCRIWLTRRLVKSDARSQ